MGPFRTSISVGGLSRARFHRRLQTPPAIYLKLEWGGSSVKLPFFSRTWPRDRTIFKGGFSQSLGSKKIRSFPMVMGIRVTFLYGSGCRSQFNLIEYL